jgi:hypothetical protein
MTRSRSFSGSLPQTSAISLIFFLSASPVPLAVPPEESFWGLEGWVVLPGELPGC